ncbi:PREDICTED: E3 ubiquitin-protein ligase RHF1A-like isoform X1 [Nicotiana attenuata]|uniref:RING-type E3 ubiquitin transferase n=1 Tax=Nicotiana attenuata TaxID=49451 RepID=A0A314LGL4_NICAT|nr:PREDICTED: E3 ubiquitin-protein ligase RHF1A-like isoform X1 [Nicotiana attenuata]OIT40179.1 e3 ubiquitin-protein ligase rhf1a [Nicotiana attenuata]
MANDSFNSPPMIASPAVVDDSFEDACSICLEPFNSDDPPAVTDCKHEYHLQCILEWSQRSKECPICWRVLALKDPASQELLAAVEIERNMRSRINVRHTNEDVETNHCFQDAPQQNDSDFEERIMRHFAAATSRVRLVNRRRRQASSGIGPTQVVPSVPVGVRSNQTQNSESTVQPRGFGFTGDGSAASATSSSIGPASSSVPPHGNGPFKLSQPPTYGPQGSSSSEFLAFSESIKSKWSAASARYKESISKGTRGFKEKLLSRNTSVKDFGKEVQREMSAGIAGVTRMIERLDLTSKRTGASEPLSACTMGTSNFPSRGVCEQGNVTFQLHDGCIKNSTIEVTPTAPSLISNTNTGQMEISLRQNAN